MRMVSHLLDSDRSRADVEREHVIRDLAASPHAERPAARIDAHDLVGKESRPGSGGERRHVDGSLLLAVEPGKSCGQHPGVDRERSGRDQREADVGNRLGGEHLEHVDVRVPSAGQDEVSCRARRPLSAAPRAHAHARVDVPWQAPDRRRPRATSLLGTLMRGGRPGRLRSTSTTVARTTSAATPALRRRCAAFRRSLPPETPALALCLTRAHGCGAAAERRYSARRMHLLQRPRIARANGRAARLRGPVRSPNVLDEAESPREHPSPGVPTDRCAVRDAPRRTPSPADRRPDARRAA